MRHHTKGVWRRIAHELQSKATMNENYMNQLFKNKLIDLSTNYLSFANLLLEPINQAELNKL